jgi:hypothetical protein
MIAEKIEGAKRERAEFELDYRIVHPGGEARDIVRPPAFAVTSITSLEKDVKAARHIARNMTFKRFGNWRRY